MFDYDASVVVAISTLEVYDCIWFLIAPYNKMIIYPKVIRWEYEDNLMFLQYHIPTGLLMIIQGMSGRGYLVIWVP